MDLVISNEAARKAAHEAQPRTLAGVLASIPNVVHVEHEHERVRVWDGSGWVRTYTVRYGEAARVFGPVSRIKYSRVTSNASTRV